MRFGLRRIRGSSVACMLLGILLVWRGFIYAGGWGWATYKLTSPPKALFGEAVTTFGFFLSLYGLARLYRRKGDPDDTDEDEPGEKGCPE
jgi:hypothetical protein